MPVITCIEDLRVLARQRVPRMFYDYADAGSWTESTYRANEADFDKMPDAIAALTKELLEIEATGDRTRAEQWFAKYDKMPDELRKALAAASDVPVDVFPDFSFPQTVQ